MRLTEPVSDETIKRISEQAIDLAIERHRLLQWNEDGEHLTRDEIKEIKRDVVAEMINPTPTVAPEPRIRLRTQI